MDKTREKLWDALKNRNWSEFEKLIFSGAEDDRGYYDYDDWPMIFLLIEAGQEDLAILWLDRGYPRAMTGGKINATILHWASKYGMPKLIEKALELGLDINELTRDNRSPLWYASDGGHLECAKLLLANGADVDGLEPGDRDNPDWTRRIDTPLCAAANAEIAELLLENGASPNIGPYGEEFAWGEPAQIFRMDEEILSPLTCAAIRGRADVVRALADRGVPLDSQAPRFMALGADYGKATLDDAAELVRMGADINGESGLEPLAVAARAGNAAFCRLLLDSGVRTLPDALSLAVLSGKRDCVDLFLDVGDPAPAIRLAAERGAGSIVDQLLERRPDLASHALLGAVSGCRLKLAREMLNRGASASFRDSDGMTPLAVLYAIDRRKGAYRFMRANPSRYPGEWALRKRWTPSEEDLEGDDFFPFFLNRPDNWNEILEKIEDDVLEFAADLIEKGAKVHARDNMNRSVIWYACRWRWLKSVPWLARLGADVNERDKNGDSAFDMGCMSGESLIIKPMIEAGAKVNARDRNGDTALLKSARKGMANGGWFAFACVSRLLDYGADPGLENHKRESLRALAETDNTLRSILKSWEKE